MYRLWLSDMAREAGDSLSVYTRLFLASIPFPSDIYYHKWYIY